MRVLAILSLIFVATLAKRASICSVGIDVADDFPDPPTLRSSQLGRDFNAISFGGFASDLGTGDVEGRVAVRGDFTVGNGYTVGYELITAGASPRNVPSEFSLVAGGDVVWGDGSIHPDGTNVPHAGAEERMLVGGTVTAPEYISKFATQGDRRSLEAEFDTAQAYYTRLSQEFSNLASSVNYLIQWETINVQCTSFAASTYVLNIEQEKIGEFSTVSSWSFNSLCNPESNLIINIKGAGDLVLKSARIEDNQFHRANILYNIIGFTNVAVAYGGELYGNFLAPQSALTSATTIGGLTIFGNIANSKQINRVTCVYPEPENPLPCLSFEETCAGLDFPLGNGVYSFKDFNAISFDSFTANTGDVEGRLAVRNDLSLGAGYSIGFELQTANNQPDNSLPFSLVVGRDATWISGSVHPDGSGNPYPGNREDIFVGRTFSTEGVNGLADRRTRDCNGVDGCLNSRFDAARTCYSSFSSNLASQSDNVAKSIAESALTLTCTDNSAVQYVVSLSGSEFAQFTYTVLDNCNFQADWIINVRGNEDVVLTGDSFPAVPGATIYNVVNRITVNVRDTSVNGNLLAPTATLNQTGGVIRGKVVAGNIAFALQINKNDLCRDTDAVVMVPMMVESDVEGITTTARVRAANSIRVDDTTTVGNVVAINGDSVTFDAPIPATRAGQLLGYNRVKASSGRGQVANKDMDSSASFLGLAFASFVVAALLI